VDHPPPRAGRKNHAEPNQRTLPPTRRPLTPRRTGGTDQPTQRLTHRIRSDPRPTTHGRGHLRTGHGPPQQTRLSCPLRRHRRQLPTPHPAGQRLIGPNGQGLNGQPPDPRWVASYQDGPVDPNAQTVRGCWNLVAHDGTWVWNEGMPAEIPTIDGEHILILDEQPYPRSWNAGRRHPHVHGWVEVESELTHQEAMLWWKRVSPAEPAIPDDQDTQHPPVPEPVVLNTTEPKADRVRNFL